MAVVEISSSGDPRLADYVGLRDRDLRRREEGLFVGEQILVVERMLALPGVVRSVLCGEPFLSRVEPLVPPEVTLYAAPMRVLESVAGFHVHRGVLAIGARQAVPRPTLEALAGPREQPRVILACEAITHADNIGALFRVAAALGAAGVLLSPTCHDPLYRRCVRMSIGHVLSLPWRQAEEWPGDLRRLAREHGYHCLGAALHHGGAPHHRLPRHPRVALVVGSEFGGLSPEVLAGCDDVVEIPMAPGVDSLNVAVAAGILLDRIRDRIRT